MITSVTISRTAGGLTVRERSQKDPDMNYLTGWVNRVKHSITDVYRGLFDGGKLVYQRIRKTEEWVYVEHETDCAQWRIVGIDGRVYAYVANGIHLHVFCEDEMGIGDIDKILTDKGAL